MKIFVGNVDGADTTPEELVALFSRYGTVTNCAVLKQYAFVHMPEKACMLRAIEALHGHELRPGRALVVKMSRPRPLHTCKIFVGNVSAACTSQELRSLFEGCGRVVECEVVKDYAFIHMEKEADAKAAIAQLNGKEVKGRRLNVELSTKGQKTGPGPAIQSGDKTKKPGAGDAAFPGTGGFSATFDYQQAFGNNTGGFDGQARQPTPPFFGRDRSPLRRSPPGAVYGAQAPSSYGVHAAAASYNAQGAVSSLGSYGAQAASYGAQPVASSLAYGAQAASYSAQPSASYNAQSAPYPAQQAVSYSSQPAAYVAQPAAAYAGQPAAYAAEASTPKAGCYGAQPIVQTQLNSYGAQASMGLSGCYGAQSAAAATGSYGAAYGAQPFASLSAPYCTPFASLAASYAAQQHPQAPVSYHGQPGNAYDGAGQPSVAYRSMPQGAIANPNSTPPPYERTRLSPPRASYEDPYKTAVAMSKRYGSDRAL